jgi:hypothetical protein
MFVGYASNHKGDCNRMWNPKTKMVSETLDVVILNRMYSNTLKNMKKLRKKQDPEDTELESVWQDKKGGTVTKEFDVYDNDASGIDSVGSSVPDTPMVNSNLDGPSMGAHTGAQHTMTLQPGVLLVLKQQHWPTITNLLKKQMTILNLPM